MALHRRRKYVDPIGPPAKKLQQICSIPGVFCLSGGGGDSFLFILNKTTTTVIRNFQPVVLVFLYSIPGVFCSSEGGG